MNDDQMTAPSEAVEDVVTADVADVMDATGSEATENTEGQDASQPAKADPDGEAEEAKTDAQLRRERRKADIKRRVEEAEQTAKELERAKERLKRFEEAAPQQPPKEADFATLEEYQAAAAAYAVNTTLDQRQRRDIEEEATGHQAKIESLQKQRQEELAQNWADQKADAMKRYTDFDAVVSNDVPITPVAAELITSSDVGADVAYYLGSNRAEAARIAALNPLEQAKEIGRIEAGLSLPKPKKATSALDPIDPVGGKATASKDPGKMTPAEYREWRANGGTY